MKLRPPAIPLITVDPYFSVWAKADKLYDEEIVHWTDSPNTMYGYVYVDGEKFRFMGDEEDTKVIEQVYFDMSALVSDYIFANDKIVLTLSFYSSLFADDLHRLSRPVSYLRVKYESADGEKHDVKIEINVSEEICIDKKGQKPVVCENVKTGNVNTVKIGAAEQDILSKYGDDLRIDWGYFYLGGKGAECTSFDRDEMKFVGLTAELNESEDYTVLFAYDDIKSINYFGKHCDAYWHKSGKTFAEIIDEAFDDDEYVLDECRFLSEKIYDDGENAGGEKYAELISLAYRQLIAAHKLALDDEGNVIFISKECFSNGCAATVDVTYPSAPFFVLYNTELLKGMLRPIFKFAKSDEWTKKWQFEFAPHDAGTYPFVTGQKYGCNREHDRQLYYEIQMPVEECGNMLVMMANISIVEGNTEFADKYADLLLKWIKYLEKYGEDPENQLCTDDFAGHLAHNCNLSLKAIMGIAGYSIILKMKGETEEADKYMAEAKAMADSWVKRAANKDGSFRLAFDREDTFSMKYNIIWDKFWGTELFAPCVLYSEFSSNKKHINAYGMPLDNRKTYTKSDWLLWTACLAPTKEEFEEFITPMWNAFNVSPSRVPMTDWYDTVTSEMVGFRHRSVQGGLYIKLLEDYLK